jgi:hypothetical protein
MLFKQLKTCEKKMQELTDSIKRPNLRIMGIEEGEEMQTKGMRNLLNKIITENFPNLEKLGGLPCCHQMAAPRWLGKTQTKR